MVAVVLDDGTIRELAGEAPETEPFQSGQLSGDGWILWWERREFDADFPHRRDLRRPPSKGLDEEIREE